MTDTRVRDELVGLSDCAWRRLVDRLEGVGDEEYLWEPAAGCWSIRPSPAGAWVADFEWPPPEPAPITTIAWRLAHITVNEDRFRPWLGLAPHPGRPPVPVASAAGAAVTAVKTTMRDRHDDLTELTDAELWEPIGAIGGPFADGTRVSWVLHVLDEVIHHSAEVALLRDLYRSRF